MRCQKSVALLLILTISSVICDTTQTESKEDENVVSLSSEQETEGCKEGFPYLSVGDYNLTSSNFSKATKSEKGLFIVVTGEDCKNCCKFEEFFQEIIDKVLTNKTITHGLKIKMARATMENNPQIKERIKRLPELVFFHKEDGYTLEHSQDISTISRILTKIITPVRTLETAEDVAEFIDRDIEFTKGSETIKSLKIVGLYSKKDEMKEELQEFRKTAKKYAVYRDLEFSILTKDVEIEKIFREKGSEWFPKYLKSTVLVVDRQKQVHKVDPTLNHEQLNTQIHLKGKRLVEQLTQETQELFRRMRWPLLISFLNPDDPVSFKSHIDTLTEVARRYEQVAFAYLNNTHHENKRNMLGIYHDKVPAISITLPDSPLLFPYPEKEPFTVTSLRNFVANFLEGKIKPFDPQSAPVNEQNDAPKDQGQHQERENSKTAEVKQVKEEKKKVDHDL